MILEKNASRLDSDVYQRHNEIKCVYQDKEILSGDDARPLTDRTRHMVGNNKTLKRIKRPAVPPASDIKVCLHCDFHSLSFTQHLFQVEIQGIQRRLEAMLRRVQTIDGPVETESDFEFDLSVNDPELVRFEQKQAEAAQQRLNMVFAAIKIQSIARARSAQR